MLNIKKNCCVYLINSYVVNERYWDVVKDMKALVLELATKVNKYNT